MSEQSDQLYKTLEAKPGSFVFDARVTQVFENMISRSVPGYQQILHLLPTLTRQFKQENANYYDLGCSLGAGLAAIAQGMDDQPGQLIGIDNSAAMIDQAKINLNWLQHQHLDLRIEDITQSDYSNAAMVLMNFTLQFIAIEQRRALLSNIYRGLNRGGVLVLSEKLAYADQDAQHLICEIHHQFKKDQGYSDLEISRKRDAIEQVLIPETLEEHTARLKAAGFSLILPWVQNLQFVSFLAVK